MRDQTVDIVKYEDEHGEHVARHMRLWDKREISFLAALMPDVAIDVTLAHAVGAWTVLLDGEPAVIWGINRRSKLSEVGVPWLLGTDAMDRAIVRPKNWLRFLRTSREYVARFAEAFPVQENYVLADYTASVKWLKWLGYEMEEPQIMGIMGQPYIRFGRNLDQCA